MLHPCPARGIAPGILRTYPQTQLSTLRRAQDDWLRSFRLGPGPYSAINRAFCQLPAGVNRPATVNTESQPMSDRTNLEWQEAMNSPQADAAIGDKQKTRMTPLQPDQLAPMVSMVAATRPVRSAAMHATSSSTASPTCTWQARTRPRPCRWSRSIWTAATTAERSSRRFWLPCRLRRTPNSDEVRFSDLSGIRLLTSRHQGSTLFT